VSADAVAGLQPGEYVRLVVADNGEGMSPETLARAAEPFFTTKPLGQGTGLGLAMARSFAQGSGGALAIASEGGKGTRVSLWLPVLREATGTEAPPAPASAAAEPLSGRPRVLLVDDDDAVRHVLATELEDSGVTVRQARSGAAALALLDRADAYDLLVSDLAMPGIDGVTLIREAQRRRPGLPAILVTGYVDDAIALASEAPSGGGFTLLRKPVTGTALTAEVARLVRRPLPMAAR
jgi:CheY-like chemotaxis protein